MRAWTPSAVPELPGRGPAVTIWDTASQAGITTPRESMARLYVCGITPYDAAHLGHAATYLAFDLLVRAWLDAGQQVRYVQNVTDVDDPLLERALITGQDWSQLADQEIDLFRRDMQSLRVLPPDHYIGAVEAIPEIVPAVAQLLADGAAYRMDDGSGDVYFAVASEPSFGTESGLTREQMLALFAARGGDPDRPGKKDPLDSLLWRAGRPDEPAWDSELGAGRPGWHIECSVIALNRLGTDFDVQGGGSDLIFPHHEHSAAHGLALTGGRRFARAYVHTGMIGLDGEKMSKSRGNLVFVSKLRQAGVDPMAVRLALLDGHYRADREWTGGRLPGAERRLNQWRTAAGLPAGPPADQLVATVRNRLADDLDTEAALDAVDRWAQSAITGRDGDQARDPGAPQLMRRLVDARLGIQL